MIGSYSALSELYAHWVCGPGAPRLAVLGACPWLSYFAPLALCPTDSEFLCKAERRYSAGNLDIVLADHFSHSNKQFSLAGKGIATMRGEHVIQEEYVSFMPGETNF